jgi:hypothetical protein
VLEASSTRTGQEVFAAEELLAWSDAELTEDERATLQELIAKREALIGELVASDLKIVDTPFGSRVDEPENLKQLRKEEHAAVLLLLKGRTIRAFRKFREELLVEVDEARKQFPLLEKPSLSIEVTSVEDVATLTIQAGAPHPHYRMAVDKVEQVGDVAKIFVTWIRPSSYALVGQKSGEFFLQSEVQVPSGIGIEVWVRVRDDDWPIRREYQRALVGQI